MVVVCFVWAIQWYDVCAGSMVVVCFVWAIQWYDVCAGNMLVCFVWAVQWYDVCADNMFVWAVQWYDVCAGNMLVCFVWAIQWYDVCRQYSAVVHNLYQGIQCSSCGCRFLMEEMEQYRQHLDWHFRLNKREKEAAKISSYRKWYFELNVSSCWC